MCHPGDPMFEHADGLDVCISVMSWILKSLDVASACGRLGTLFCGSRIGGHCRHAFRAQTRCELGDRLDDRQRGSAEIACRGAASLDDTRATVCDKQSVTTSVEAVQDSLRNAMRQVPAASSTSVASVATDADVVEKAQMVGEKSVSVTGPQKVKHSAV